VVYRAAATRRRFLQAVRGSRRRTPPCPPVAHYRCPFIREPNSSRANGTSSHDSVLIGAVLARACLTRERQNCPDRPGTGRHGAPPATPPERSTVPRGVRFDHFGITTWSSVSLDGAVVGSGLGYAVGSRRGRRVGLPLGVIAAGAGGLVSGRLSARMVEGMLYAISPTGPGWIGESTAKRLRVRRATSVRWFGGEEYVPWCGDDQQTSTGTDSE